MKRITTILLISISSMIFGQTTNNLEKIIKLGDEWKFDEAIELLKNEIKTDPENPELYYWLGRYCHYIVSDSRPFPEKSDQWSKEQVMKPLQKAIELKPDYGDAKYFLAAEYGARANEALRRGDVEQYKQELLDAKKWGGFPDHAIEQVRNVLKSCDPNTILIVDGDAHTNILQYLQVIEGYRKDVSVITMTYLVRPYYIKLIRDGIPDVYKPVPIKMSDNLIMEMHDYKWKENDIVIPISEQTRELYNLNDSITQFVWHVNPDIGKGSLSPATAMLINILEANKWGRPVHYLWFGIQDLDGLEENMKIKGLTAEIFPIKVKGTNKEYDIEKFESVMLNPENYVNYNDIAINNQPRVSYSFGQLSRRRILNYAYYLYSQGEKEQSKEVIEKMNELMPPEIFAYSKDIDAGIERFKDMNKKNLSELISDAKTVDEIIQLIVENKINEMEYDLSEIGIYRFGHSLIDDGDNEEALKIYKLGTEMYPEGYIVFDGYGECLMLLGQKEEAINAYKKSLEINPDNKNAEEIIKNNQ